jgi:uncharacterized protein YnzC (UPF0291/DUF896 family)
MILENLLFDIKSKFYPYKMDIKNQNEILNNATLDQPTKLLMMNDHKKFHVSLKKIYNTKSYPIFKFIMESLVQKSFSHDKLLNKINELRKRNSDKGLSKKEKELLSAISQSQNYEKASADGSNPIDDIKKFDDFGASPEQILESSTDDAIKL